jgi:hypothetical protein
VGAGAAATSDGGERALRVTVVDHVTEPGGGQLAIARLAEALRPHVRMSFVVPGPGPYPELLASRGFDVAYVPIGRARDLEIADISPLRDTLAHGPRLVSAAA